MIVSSKEILERAREGHYAVPAANFVDPFTASVYTETAESLGLPIILQFAESHSQYLSVEDAIATGKYYAQKSSTPVVLHLDHGRSKELIFKAVDAGFSSVMIDASDKPYDENVAAVREIVAYAHPKGVVVEAEIGHVGEGSLYANNTHSNNIYTTPEEAVRFVADTGVDSLAVSIGTAHGKYKGTPVLDFVRLKELREAVPVPLVLHGGSGSGNENLQRCAEDGIAKINVFTDFVTAAYDAVQNVKPNGYFDLRDAMADGIADKLRENYTLFHTQK